MGPHQAEEDPATGHAWVLRHPLQVRARVGLVLWFRF